MDTLNNVFFSTNVFFGCLFNIVAIALVVKKRNESQNKYYTFMLFLQFGMAFISAIVLGYLRLHIYVFDEYLVVFLRPLDSPLSNDFIHIGLIGFLLFLLYFNITIPTALIAARFSIVCTNSGFKRNTIIRVLGLCITLTIIQAAGITFPFTKHVSSNIIINAIKKYNIESDILTESTVALGRKVVCFLTINFLNVNFLV
uniref:G_PROTEIN_RECEP_F1_2 domain-containing protein n=1 Tax=Strongyloides papillosus TaxID=174720 RepID=A0A0N5BIK6_STREA